MPELADELERLAGPVADQLATGQEPARDDLRAAVKATTKALAIALPGRTLEVRVPPYAAVQCLDGPRHTRGTPPNVVETDGATWLLLCAGRLTWEAVALRGRARDPAVMRFLYNQGFVIRREQGRAHDRIDAGRRPSRGPREGGGSSDEKQRPRVLGTPGACHRRLLVRHPPCERCGDGKEGLGESLP